MVLHTQKYVWCCKAATQDHYSIEPEREHSAPEVFSFLFEFSFSFWSPGSVIDNQRTLLCVLSFTNNFVPSLTIITGFVWKYGCIY